MEIDKKRKFKMFNGNSNSINQIFPYTQRQREKETSKHLKMKWLPKIKYKSIKIHYNLPQPTVSHSHELNISVCVCHQNLFSMSFFPSIFHSFTSRALGFHLNVVGGKSTGRKCFSNEEKKGRQREQEMGCVCGGEKI